MEHARELGTKHERACYSTLNRRVRPLLNIVKDVLRAQGLHTDDVQADSNLAAVTLQTMRNTRLQHIEQECCRTQNKHSCYRPPALSPALALNRASIFKPCCRHRHCSHHEACTACIPPSLDNLWQTP